MQSQMAASQPAFRGGGAASVLLVIMAGQSNMNGRNADDGLTTGLTETYEYVGNDDDGTYQTLQPVTGVLHHAEAALPRTGPDEQILVDLRTLYPSHKIVAVPCCQGSTALAGGATPAWASSDTPGSGGVRFEFMVDQANAARTAVLAAWPGAAITTLIYLVQGEQDAVLAVSTATYQAALADFVINSRSRITGAATAKFIIGSMLPQKWIIGSANYAADYAAINAGHVAASVAGVDVYYVMGPDDRTANDNLHYQNAAVARLFGTALVNVLSDVTGPTMTSANTKSNGAASMLSHLLTSNDVHATFHINGGADEEQFEISDQYITPTLRWVGNGTGPAAASYEVGVRARDGKGNYGATQTITVTVAAEVSPTSFFTGGERGMVRDLTDLANLSQTIDGLTPVTATGQPVGWVRDLSPNNNHWIAAANNTTRPTYEVDADGKPYLNFDGINDILFAATPFITATNGRYTACAGVFGPAPAAVRVALGSYSTSTTTPFMEPFSAAASGGNLTTNMRNDGGSGAGTQPILTGMLDNAAKRVITSAYNGSNSTIRMRNETDRPVGGGSGGYQSVTQGTFANNFALTRAALGGRGFASPSGYWQGRIYSGYEINRYLTDNEVRDGGDWTAARCLTGLLP